MEKDPKKSFEMARIMYVRIIRPLVYKKVVDSETKIDDWILLLLDKIFDIEDGEIDFKG